MSLEKIRQFVAGDYFLLIMFVIALVVITTNQFVLGSMIFIMFTSAVLVLTPDIVSCLTPMFFMMGTVIQAYDPKSQYGKYAVLFVIFVICIIFHLVHYRVKEKDSNNEKPGELLLPMVLTSITCFVGGIFHLQPASYFSTTSLLYMFGLGFFNVIMYYYLYNHIGPGKNYNSHVGERFANIFCIIMLLLFISAVEGYIEHWDKFIADPGILYFQWRNNASTIIMMFMPFAFMKGFKKFRYVILAFLSYFTILILGSRGGLVLGGVEFAALIIFYAVKDKNHRKYILIVLGIVLAGVAIMMPKIISFMRYTISRFTSLDQYTVRLEQWARAIEDFKNSPIVGMGLGYMGNRDVHPSKVGSLCWYHNSVFQVIGSFGLVGVCTYGYQFFCRLRFILKRKTPFGNAVLWSFIGLELMSLVNPGIFTLPYLILLNMLLITLERYEPADAVSAKPKELPEAASETVSAAIENK